MKIICFARHAEAENRPVNTTDLSRKLPSSGKSQCSRVDYALRTKDSKPDILISSPERFNFCLSSEAGLCFRFKFTYNNKLPHL